MFFRIHKLYLLLVLRVIIVPEETRCKKPRISSIYPSAFTRILGVIIFYKAATCPAGGMDDKSLIAIHCDLCADRFGQRTAARD